MKLSLLHKSLMKHSGRYFSLVPAAQRFGVLFGIQAILMGEHGVSYAEPANFLSYHL